MEGGTDLDLEILDLKEDDETKKDKVEMSLFAVEAEKSVTNSKSNSEADDKKSSEPQENSDKAPECTDSKDESADQPSITSGEKNGEEEKAPEDASENNEGSSEEVSETPAEVETDDANATQPMEEGEAVTSNGENETKNAPEPEGPPVPRPLHRTASIFLRNLPPNVTRAEVLEICRKFNGFLRLSIADPQSDRKFYRRGWATFSKDVQIKDICWQFNKHKFGGIECGAIINRELSRRIRSVNGIASQRAVVRADIRHAAKIVYNLDRSRGLWLPTADDNTNAQEERPQFSDSRNPLLHNITDYLIEEADAEEEELLGSESDQANDSGQGIERDEQLIKVLDRILLYLRIVHSLDYYNHTDYPQEDEMPNRIGIMHARGSPPSSKVTLKEINEYIKNFEEKIKPFLETVAPLTEKEAKTLGLTTEEEAVKQFIKDNTKNPKEDKYECAIEKKKFKAPEFVEKHIHNKHQNLIEDTKKEAICFNNYIMDPKRPALPEHPSNRPQQGSPRDAMSMSPQLGPAWPGNPAAMPYPPPFAYGAYGPPRGPPGFMPMPWPGARGAFPPMPPAGYGMAMPPSRVLKSYRDLDAPNDW